MQHALLLQGQHLHIIRHPRKYLEKIGRKKKNISILKFRKILFCENNQVRGRSRNEKSRFCFDRDEAKSDPNSQFTRDKRRWTSEYRAESDSRPIVTVYQGQRAI